MKREPFKWENIFANDIPDKGLFLKYIKTYTIQHQNEKQSNLKMGKRSE